MALTDICLGVEDVGIACEMNRGNVGVVQDMRLRVGGRMTFELSLKTPTAAQVKTGVSFGPNSSLTGTFAGSGSISRGRLVNHA